KQYSPPRWARGLYEWRATSVTRPRRFADMIAERLAGEDAPQRRLEGRERHGVVIRVEGVLVVFGAEIRAGFEQRVAAVAFPRVAVAAQVMEVVIALEQAVMLDDPVSLGADIGQQ